MVELINRELIAQEIRKRVRAKTGLLPFTTFTFPGYNVNWHHELIAAKLDRVLSGECKRLMIFTPPRHGKTELASNRFPAFVLGRRPDYRVLSTSYNDEYAGKASREVQRIMVGEEYEKLFPKVCASKKSNRRGHIHTTGEFELPGFRGGYKCSGIGGGITGRGFNIGIIDDPIKDRMEAESPAYRTRVWEWYTSTFFTRRDSSNAAIILIQTRWHHDDLAGRLLKEMENGGEQWEVLNLPALAEGELHPEDPREQGGALWPLIFDRNALLLTKNTIGIYDWSALYQGEPVPREGGLFKVKFLWERLLEEIDRNEILRSVRYWDKAATKGAGCNSAGALLHEMRDRSIVIADCIAGQWSSLEREKRIKRAALLDGKRVKIWCEQEPGSGGKESAEATIRNLSGYVIKADKVTGSKEARAEPFSSQVEGGNVYVLNREWTKPLLDELEIFPAGKFRDRADACSGAFNKLFFKRITPHVGSAPSAGEKVNPEDGFQDLLDAATPEERKELERIIEEEMSKQ